MSAGFGRRRTKENREPWGRFLKRFTNAGRGFFESYHDQVVGTVQLARELPDSERPQFGVMLQSSALNDNPGFAVTGLNVDLRIEKIAFWAMTSGTVAFATAGIVAELACGYLSTAFNPVLFNPVVVAPQIRPRLTGGTTFTANSVGIQGEFSNGGAIGPPASVIGYREYGGDRALGGGGGPERAATKVIDFGPDGQIVPAGTLFGGTLANPVAGANWSTLVVSVLYRELA